jgi:hypothetical protein
MNENKIAQRWEKVVRDRKMEREGTQSVGTGNEVSGFQLRKGEEQ